jgi:hypothetical protein
VASKRNVFFVDYEVIKKQIPGPLYKNKIKAFEKYFQEQLLNVTENLAKSGVTVAQEGLREAKTEWGKSRMIGNHYGVRFAPFGRSEGRERTGFMYDSLSWDVQLKNGKNNWRGLFGWPQSAITQAPYIIGQENGFYSAGKFDPVATAKSGIAKFREGKEKWIPGAKSLPKAAESIRKRAQAAYSAAWNQARKNWFSDNMKANPGTYLEARTRAGRGRF